MLAAWARRNSRHPGPEARGAGPSPPRASSRRTVDGDTPMLSLASSPVIRRWPQRGLSRASRSTSARTSAGTGGRPRRLGGCATSCAPTPDADVLNPAACASWSGRSGRAEHRSTHSALGRERRKSGLVQMSAIHRLLSSALMLELRTPRKPIVVSSVRVFRGCGTRGGRRTTRELAGDAACASLP
jgi:hypothetical protein